MADNIDFSAGLSLDDVESAAILGTDKSTWVKTLTALYEGVREGQGEYGVFYKVGSYKNASGASTAIRNIKNDYADRLPAEFDLRPIVKADPNDSTKRVSFLYAAVAAPDDLDDEGDPDEEETEEQDGEVTEEVDEAPAPRKRKR